MSIFYKLKCLFNYHDWLYSSYMVDCLVEECGDCKIERFTYYEDKEIVKESIVKTTFLHNKYK